MDDNDVRRYWEENAEAWTALSRAGYDRSRIILNTPAFMRILPEIKGLRGLDIGCGEGCNTRLLAQHGASMTGVDIAPTFVKYARQAEHETPLGVEYVEASAARLPFENAQFDFVTGFMSLQDMADQAGAVAEALRVLRPGGFFQFSILHPCFVTPQWGWVRDETKRKKALLVGDYFRDGTCRVDEWIFSAMPEELKERYPKFKSATFEHTLSSWLNMLVRAGFRLEEFAEPTPDDEALAKHPDVYDARIIAYFLIVRCRKPA